MRAISRPWGTLHARIDECGGTHAAVFLNSLGTDTRMWDSVVRGLPELAIAVRLDFRGHGLSAVAPYSYSIADLADDVLACMDTVDLERAKIIGCSVGGLVAQQLSLAAPDRVEALVLSNCAPKLGTAEAWIDRVDRVNALGMPGMASEIVERWFAQPSPINEPEVGLWRTMLERIPSAGYVALCHAIAEADLSQSVHNIDLPALVIAGSSDRATPADAVQALADLLPQAQYLEFEGVGHLPAIESPEAFNAAVSQFFGSLPNE